MGNCLAHDARTPQQSAGTRCSYCGEPAPQRRLRGEAADEWVQLRGAWAHRRCAVAARLAEAREERERAAYDRAKQAVYPLPSKLLHAHHGDEMHEVQEGMEWAHSESFRLPYRPSDSVATLQQHLQERQQEDGGAAAAAADRPAAADAPAAAEAAEPDAACTQAAAAAVGMQLEHAAARGGPGSGSACLLERKPSPVHGEALFEAKTLRRLSGPHPAFQGEALHADPDGAAGKEWRAACRQAAAERAAREARLAAAAADANGF